jgi:hypothetical protein
VNATTSTPAAPAAAPRTRLNRAQTGIIWAVAAGAITIAGLGFLGSYTAVADLAAKQHFGDFAKVFPIAIDAGIGVLLALDLLLTWLRIPFLLLRPMAWTFTLATIGFNAATSWPHLLGTSMHAAIPTLFVIIVEAARHAIGRLAQLHAGALYENPPATRWFLSPWPTYRIWRRMRMWNIRSYNDVIEMERQTKVLRATLKARYGRSWKDEADKRELLALRLAKLGTPVGETLAGRYEATLPIRSAASRRVATASATPAAIPAAATPPVASPAPATATPASPGTATPAAANASAESVYVPAAATASEPVATASAKPATASATSAAGTEPASKPAASGEQRDLDEVADAFRQLRTDLGKSPSDAALAAALGVGRSRAQQLRTAAIAAGHTDLEKPLRAAS